MTKNKIESLQGKLIVSCQALPQEPLHSSFIMGRMALAAREGGAYGIRDYADSEVYITPTMKEVDELMEIGPEIIALDATGAPRPGGMSLDEFFWQAKEKYPKQLWMADCSTVEEAFHADSLGFDFIGTTMVGYTPQSRHDQIEADDFRILREIIAGVKHRVIAEGNINTPAKAKRVIELGAFSVVVGSVITRPQLITKSFAEALVP